MALLCFAGLHAQNNFLDFDGVNDAVILPHTAALSQVSQVTFEVWVHPDMNDLHTLFDDDGVAGITQSLMWQVNSSGRMSAHYRNGPGTRGHNTYTANGAIPAQQWTHVALVYDGTEPLGLTRMRLYVNGVDATATQAISGSVGNVTPDMTGNTPPGIGILDNNFGSRVWTGKMDEFRIWTTARTAAEINANMNSTLTGNEPGLFAYYPFDEGTCGGNNAGITNVPDLANGNDGTLMNSSLVGCNSNWVCSGATCAFSGPPVQPATVPTLSEWGLILLGLTVLCLGAIAIRRRQGTEVSSAS